MAKRSNARRRREPGRDVQDAPVAPSAGRGGAGAAEPARTAEDRGGARVEPRAGARVASRAASRLPARSERVSRTALVLGLAFFASGAAGLIHEVVWTRLLGHVFGVSSFAIATVLAAYMGGLALGSWWVGARTGRLSDARLAYALLEIGIGVAALAVPALLAIVEPLYGAIWRSYHLSFGVFSALRLLLAGAILLAPTVMMGATFPVLATDSARRAGERIPPHWLYTLNIAGAVGGAILAGFALLPGLGVWGTIIAGAVLNVAAAAAALTLPRAPVTDATAAAGDEDDVARAADTDTQSGWNADLVPRAALHAAAFASGAVALAAQVAWSRVLSRIVGSTTYAFTSVLVATLVALGVGSALAARLGRRRETAAAAIAPAFLLAGLLALVAIAIVHRLPSWYLALYSIWAPEAANGLVARGLATAFLATFAPVACAGMVLPLVLAVAVPADAGATGAAVGRVYAVNTLGSILGALLAGFVLVPGIGTQHTLAGGALVCVAMGAIVAFASPRPMWLRPAAILAAGFAILAARFTPPWSQRLLHFGVAEAGFHAGGTEVLRERFATAESTADILYEREGRTASVIVIQIGPVRGMKIDARANASDYAGDMSTQSMLALYPLALAPRTDDVFVVGWGTGVTVGAALQAPVRSITAVELEPAVVEASHLFDHVNHRPLEDERVKLYEDDARHILLASEDTYDVIISEPPHPWVAGVANLFTRDFYELAARRLRPDGVFAQWVQSYQISFDTYRTILATFQSVFPEITVFIVPNGSDTILVGSRAPLDLGASALARRWADDRFLAELGHYEMGRPEKLLAGAVIGPDDVRRIARDAPINTDDNMLVEFGASVGTTNQIDMGLDEIRKRATPIERLTTDGASLVADRERLAAYVEGLRLMRRDTAAYEARLGEGAAPPEGGAKP